MEEYTAYCFELTHQTTVSQIRRALAKHLHIAYRRLEMFGVEFNFRDGIESTSIRGRERTSKEIPLPMD
eukprot:2100392-Amphidinium_carterae.1